MKLTQNCSKLFYINFISVCTAFDQCAGSGAKRNVINRASNTASMIADELLCIRLHSASVMQLPSSQIGASGGQTQPGSQASEHTGVGFAHVATHPG